MKILKPMLAIFIVTILGACIKAQEDIKAKEDIKTTATGEIITDMKARATSGWSGFDGEVDEQSDLEDLVKT